MAPQDAPRPTMRRKSSAQNLLSFNKPTQSASASGTSTPSLPHYPLPSGPLSSSFTSAATTLASASTPTAREWDVQSMHSDATGMTGTTLASGSTPFTQASVEYLRDTVQKRIITLTYLRNVHDGCAFLSSDQDLSGTNTLLQSKSLVSYHRNDPRGSRQGF